LAAVADTAKVAVAMLAYQRQAAAELEMTWASLADRGLGFNDDLREQIETYAAVHPHPPGFDPEAGPTPASEGEARALAAHALEADHPAQGFGMSDPRLAPIEGVSLPLLAIGAKAIGWADDATFVARVAKALGVDAEAWRRAAEGWRARIESDPVLGAYYAQLYVQA
jgi:hypothetical protein